MSFGSSSAGNCYFLGTPEYGILIDGGLGYGAFKKQIKAFCGMSNDGEHAHSHFCRIWGLLVTHGHIDHVREVRKLSNDYEIDTPLYMTEDALKRARQHDRRFRPDYIREVHPGDSFQIRDFHITVFALSHDAPCVGYFIERGDTSIAIATDTGVLTGDAKQYMRRANYIILDCDYDEQGIKNARRPREVKERCISDKGHLSNQYVANFLNSNNTPVLRHIFLAHTSEESNSEELITAEMAHTPYAGAYSILPREEPSVPFEML